MGGGCVIVGPCGRDTALRPPLALESSQVEPDMEPWWPAGFHQVSLLLNCYLCQVERNVKPAGNRASWHTQAGAARRK